MIWERGIDVLLLPEMPGAELGELGRRSGKNLNESFILSSALETAPWLHWKGKVCLLRVSAYTSGQPLRRLGTRPGGLGEPKLLLEVVRRLTVLPSQLRRQQHTTPHHAMMGCPLYRSEYRPEHCDQTRTGTPSESRSGAGPD
jgi:hypothetical protein